MNKLREIEEYLRTWLERVKQANKAAPIVQETYEEVTWARQALDARPPEAANLPTTQIDQWVDEAYKNIKTLLPQIPHFDANTVIQVNCRRYRKRPQKRYFGTGQRRDKDGPLP